MSFSTSGLLSKYVSSPVLVSSSLLLFSSLPIRHNRHIVRRANNSTPSSFFPLLSTSATRRSSTALSMKNISGSRSRSKRGNTSLRNRLWRRCVERRTEVSLLPYLLTSLLPCVSLASFNHPGHTRAGAGAGLQIVGCGAQRLVTRRAAQGAVAGSGATWRPTRTVSA